jgi:hypothetical protein
MQNQPTDTDLLLVAIMPEPRDFEIARLFGWYRIPEKKAPKTLLVDYLAFYQPASFGAQAHGIYWYAPLLGHELSTRRQLLQNEPNHPRADEAYFKLQIGALQKRIPPLLSARWRRLSFFYTIGAYFNTAQDLTDLLVGNAERELLWQALRERGYHTEKAYSGESPALELSVLCALGNLQIHLIPEEQTIPVTETPYQLYLPQRRVREQPDACLLTIDEQIARLGGQAG